MGTTKRRTKQRRKEIPSDIYDNPIYADKAYIAESLTQMLVELGSPLKIPVKKERPEGAILLFQDAFTKDVQAEGGLRSDYESGW